MPIDTEDVQSAFTDFDVECDNDLAAEMTQRLNGWMAENYPDRADERTVENHVKVDLDRWVVELTGSGGSPTMEALEGRLVVMEADINTELGHQRRQKNQLEKLKEEGKLSQQARAEDMDLRAEAMGLPKFQHDLGDETEDVLGEAPMDDKVVKKLDPDTCILTSALSSCTGVSIYDPESEVGAVLHVYHNIDLIQEALKEMGGMAPNLDPSKLQVALLPGNTDGVDASHLPRLHEKLREAGIPAQNVRDLSLENRRGTNLTLKHGGSVSAFSREKVEKAEKEKAPGNRVQDGAKLQPIVRPGADPQAKGNSVGAKLGRSHSAPNLKNYTQSLG